MEPRDPLRRRILERAGDLEDEADMHVAEEHVPGELHGHGLAVEVAPHLSDQCERLVRLVAALPLAQHNHEIVRAGADIPDPLRYRRPGDYEAADDVENGPKKGSEKGNHA